MDGMILARRHASHALAGVFEQPRDALVPAIPRHLDQAAVVVSVPLRVGAGIEQELNRFGVPFTHGEMNGGRIPVLSSTEFRIPANQSAKCWCVASGRGGDRVPGIAAIICLEFPWSDHRAFLGPLSRLACQHESRPACEAITAREDELRVRKLRLAPADG